MQTIKHLVIFAVSAYLALLLLLFAMQRKMMYLPDMRSIRPAEADLTGASLEKLPTRDGETIAAWYIPPSAGRALIIYFHGNGGQIADRIFRYRMLARNGDGVLAVSYRGFGGSTGTPTENGLIEDARAAYAFARAKGVSPDRILLFGESLGSGVAVALGASEQTGGIILEAPFSSAADVGASVYWMFPVRWLMRDQFRSDARIGSVKAPIFIVHGDADPVVPIRFGRKLFEAAKEPKTFLTIPGGDHQVIEIPQVGDRVLTWIDERVLSP